MILVGHWLAKDLNSELSVEHSSVLDCAVALDAADSLLEQEAELCRERFVLRVDGETLLSVEVPMTED